MTDTQIRRRFGWSVALGLLGTTGLVALAAEESTASSTFLTVAEKFGVFAAMSLVLTGCAVYGLWKITSYAIGRLEAVVDDNTMAFSRFATQMRKRPCQRDSDIDRIIENEPEPTSDDSDDPIVKRVTERRAQRAVKKVV